MPPVNTGLGGPQDVGENSYLGGFPDFGNYDDGAYEIDLTGIFGPAGMNYFGTNYTSLYINSNGLITFEGPNTAFTPTGLSGITEPAIAPLWTDYDVTGGSATGTNNIYWDITSDSLTITWLEVEAYSGGVAGTNTFQMVLTSTGGGNFDLEFIYEDIQFADGYTGVAVAGVTDGSGTVYEVPGSGDATAVVDFETGQLAADDPIGTYDLVFTDGTPPCFVAGTLIRTARGDIPVEQLRVGDRVLTRDNNFQPIVWLGRSVSMGAEAAPVRIKADTFGNSRDLCVSRAHRILLEGAMAELYTGEHEVFANAGALANGSSVQIETGTSATHYFHILLPAHEIICAEGAWVESFYPGTQALDALPARTRTELMQCARADTLAGLRAAGPCRPEVKRFEAQLIAHTPGACAAEPAPALAVS